MINLILHYLPWIIVSVLLIGMIACVINERRVNKRYPQLKEEIKNCQYRFLNITLTNHYIVKGKWYKNVIPYEEIQSYEEVTVDMYFRSAGKAIALKRKDGSIIEIANIAKNFQKAAFTKFKANLSQFIC